MIQLYSGDGGPATSAFLNNPGICQLRWTHRATLYIADTNNYRIREVSGGIITTGCKGNWDLRLCGRQRIRDKCRNWRHRSGLATWILPIGNLYHRRNGTNGNSRIRHKVSGGVISTYAGAGCCYSGDNGPATSALMNSPQGLALDTSGNLYIADSNNQRIREVETNGTITTVAGNGTSGFLGDGGAATSAEDSRTPTGLAVDSSGNLVIADQTNQRIRKVIGGTISTVAGGGSIGDGGAAPFAALGQPAAVVKDASGNLYIADPTNNRIRKITPAGVVSTVAGTGTPGFSGDGAPATSATLNSPQSVAVDSAGDLFIYDSSNVRIRKVDTSGNITTIGGQRSACHAIQAMAVRQTSAGSPMDTASVHVDGSGNIYIAETNIQRIR